MTHLPHGDPPCPSAPASSSPVRKVPDSQHPEGGKEERRLRGEAPRLGLLWVRQDPARVTGVRPESPVCSAPPRWLVGGVHARKQVGDLEISAPSITRRRGF